ncbi:hypothetical protein SteCoe_18877 [Stentor coeruleus]|uniref:RING-type domain-containing protein n=1 Tax=Stentor coeruleus TaxID=5963 RepID=A0A1R2BVH4_9CILI|nr:hypothetical protein SteCoe_18877 [Stentor coeruleus]
MEENTKYLLKPECSELKNEVPVKALIEELGKVIDPLVFADKVYKKFNELPIKIIRSKLIKNQEIKDIAQIFEGLMKCSFCSRKQIEITTVCNHKFCTKCFSKYLCIKEICDEDPRDSSISYKKIIFKCPNDNCYEITEFFMFDLIEAPRNLNEYRQKKHLDLFLEKMKKCSP